jgi:hypothetical protein
MKATLNIEDSLMRVIKARAAVSGCTMSSLVEKLLRAGLRAHAERRRTTRMAKPLPVFDMGPPRVDLADRAALASVMAGEPLRGYDRPRRRPYQRTRPARLAEG